MFEQVAGELRAKLMGGGGARPSFDPTHQATRQHTRRRGCGGHRRDGGSGCGARGRCRGLSGLQDEAQPHVSTPGPTGVEGTGGMEGQAAAPIAVVGPGCGARGRRRGPARQRADTQAHVSTPGPTGVEGTGGMEGQAAAPIAVVGPGCGARGRRRGLAGLRGDAPSQRLAARTARGRAAAHGHTKQPGPTTHQRRPKHPWGHNETRPRPVSRPRPRHAHAAPFTTALPVIRRSCPRDPRPRRGQPRGGQRGRGTGSRTRSRHPRCGRSGSTAGRHRARHTRRA